MGQSDYNVYAGPTQSATPEQSSALITIKILPRLEQDVGTFEHHNTRRRGTRTCHCRQLGVRSIRLSASLLDVPP